MAFNITVFGAVFLSILHILGYVTNYEICQHVTHTFLYKALLTNGSSAVNSQVKSSQVTFIYIAPLTIQILTKHCTISK